MKLEMINERYVNKPNYVAAEKLFRIGSYEVEVTKYSYVTGDIHRTISVEKNYCESYMPEIYFRDNELTGEAAEFVIQTTSYGSLKPAEIKGVIAGYETAVEVVEILTKEFLA